jgi:hypothetical protein
MTKVIFYHCSLIFILVGCSLTSSLSDSDSLSESYFDNEKIKISTSNLSGNLDVIFYKNNQNLQKYFLQGVQSGFFYINANKKEMQK